MIGDGAFLNQHQQAATVISPLTYSRKTMTSGRWIALDLDRAAAIVYEMRVWMSGCNYTQFKSSNRYRLDLICC
jgi:hypothetical protein